MSDLFDLGYDAGNYANAYSDTDLDAAWDVMEDGDRPVNNKAFRAGFILGFFSSYENTEVPEEYLEEFVNAGKSNDLR